MRNALKPSEQGLSSVGGIYFSGSLRFGEEKVPADVDRPFASAFIRRIYEAIVPNDVEWKRAGDSVCEICGMKYSSHPFVKVVGTFGPLELAVLCDGSNVKL